MTRVLTRSLPILVVVLTACVKPTFPNDPRNTLTVSKGAFGTELAVANGADTDVSLKGLKGNKSTGEIELAEATFNSRQSENQKVLIDWIRETNQQLLAKIAFQKQLGENTVAILDATGRNIMPTLSAFLGGLNQVALVKAQRPGLLGDVASILRELNKIDPSLVTEAVNLATSQPSLLP